MPFETSTPFQCPRCRRPLTVYLPDLEIPPPERWYRFRWPHNLSEMEAPATVLLPRLRLVEQPSPGAAVAWIVDRPAKESVPGRPVWLALLAILIVAVAAAVAVSLCLP